MNEKIAEECKAFLLSDEFERYAKAYPVAYAKACIRIDLITERNTWPVEWKRLGNFCQVFWETLPDDPSIRRGAFFRLCDFAEQYVFGH